MDFLFTFSIIGGLRYMKKCIIFLLLVSLIQSVSSQYKIEFTIKPLKDEKIILAHYFNKSFFVQDSGLVNSKGSVILSGNKSLPQGLYIVYLNPSLRFDLIIGDEQHFSIITDTTDFVNHTVVTGSKENEIFFEYQRFLADKRKLSNQLIERFSHPADKVDSLSARTEFELVNEEVKDFVENLIHSHNDLFVSKFLLAMKEIVAPDPPRDEAGTVSDSLFQVKYIKKHYWDNFDLSDVRMLRTPFYEDKLTNYLNNWIYPHPDSIFKEVDFLIESSRTDTLLFRYMLSTLFNHYARSKFVGMDAIYLYIGEKYFIPEAWWADKKFIASLEERIHKHSPLLIGKTAPDIQLVRVDDDHFKFAELDTSIKNDPYVGTLFNLHSIKAKYTVLYFWEPECGHCKKVIPDLYDVFLRNKERGLQVLSVNMLGYPKKALWVDFINQHHMYGWINAWNPYNMEPSYREVYNVESSNILYLLDENKKIILKFVGPQQVEDFINRIN